MCDKCFFKENGHRRFFIFARIMDSRGRTLSVGWNSYVKTHPMQVRYAKRIKRPEAVYVHAEIMAISRLRYHQLKKATTIVVYRFDAMGNPVSAKPCPICMLCLKEMTNITDIRYTVPNNNQGMTHKQYMHILETVDNWI